MSRKKKARKLEAALNRQHPQLPLREHSEPVARALTQRWRHWLVPSLIALVTFAAFLPALQNQFVSWDDPENFLDNAHYRGLGWSQLRWMWTTHQGHYIPLTWMTLGLDYLLWGMNPVGYHLTNLLLHMANAAVFYAIGVRLLGAAKPDEANGVREKLGAAVAALLFAVHPLRVESVAWATERRDVLCGLFYLLAVLAYLRAWRGPADGAVARRWYWSSVVLFALALLSKAMAMTLPVTLLILDIYPLRRLTRGTGG